MNMWNSKKKSFFRQSTALIVAGALLGSIILPPFASASSADRQAKQHSSKSESFQLRDRLLFNKPKAVQVEELNNTFQNFGLQPVDRSSEFPGNILNVSKEEFESIR